MSQHACPKLLLALALLLSLAAVHVNSLNCVQCSSLKNPACNIGLIPPTPCPGDDYYCVMYMVLLNDARAVVRSCSPTSLSGCVLKSLGKLNATICYDSCSWDGCNAPRMGSL